MKKVSIIGAGNVSWHLSKSISKLENWKLNYILSRSKSGKILAKERDAKYTRSYEKLVEADIIIIAVSDDQINAVVNALQPFIKNEKKSPLIVHTSGSFSIKYISKTFFNAGVFYPLQTFTSGVATDLSFVPFMVDATNDKSLKLLKKLASDISINVLSVGDKEREDYHLAAVIINNFTNHLIHCAQEFLGDRKLSFDPLYPLIMETVRKASQLGAYEAQTGPARRYDVNTMKKHLKKLEGDDDLKNLYQYMSELIIKNYQS